MSSSTLLFARRPESCQVIETGSVRTALIAVTDAVRTHPFCVSVEASYEVLKTPITKILIRYPDLLRDKFFAYRQRKAGHASYRLVICRAKKDRHESFIVLMSSARDELEKWQDVRERKERLMLYDYELFRLTKLGQKEPSWSWRISGTKFEALQHAYRLAIDRHADDKLQALIESTKKWPGFSGVRTQHRELGQIVADRWKRSRKGEPPAWPRLSYVTRRNAPKRSERIKVKEKE